MILGVDPGAHGALALLHRDGSIACILDMPVVGVLVGGKSRDRVSAAGIAAFVREWQAKSDRLHAVIEQTQPMSRMGEVGAFGLGKASGLVEGVLTALGVPITLVAPRAWKKFLTVRADKGSARLKAQQTWPDHQKLFSRVKDDGRAEAALLGLYGVRRAVA